MGSHTAKHRILTCGDGDLSLSLALARAYGSHIELTASVLDSEQQLEHYFPDAPIAELKSLKVEILYGLDSTQLHDRFPPNSWDLICFHHPHLGLNCLERNEQEHANRHFRLLSHYMHSATQVSKYVHICLCGSQADTWRLSEVAMLSNLKLWKQLSTSVPFCRLWTDNDITAAEAQPHFAVPRRYRYGKLASRHMLGRYGYRHRRTEGERYKGNASQCDVSGSVHFVFQKEEEKDESATNDQSTASISSSKHICKICQASFSSKDELSKHMTAPALPDVEATTISNDAQRNKPLSNPQPELLNPNIHCIEHLDTKKKELQVSQEYDGKRLRWFIKHGIKSLSKKQAETSIQSGVVLVNGTVALDSGRILKCGDVILVGETVCNSSSHPLKILYAKQPLIVVMKPSGMRTKGKFPQTLESTISEQQGVPYSCLTPLDTSCTGLAVLVEAQKLKDTDQRPSILYRMTALIYGQVPDSWKPSKVVTITVESKWKKKRKHDAAAQQQEPAKLIPFETTEDSSLTTIFIETTHPSSSTICQLLRSEGHGVVGDSYCKQEYLKLKRSIRNRIKDRLCVGCHQLELDGVEVKAPVQDKLLASFWNSHCSNNEENNR